MAPNKKNGNEYYSQVSESMKSLFNLTTRIDERVLSLMKSQEQINEKLDVNAEKSSQLESRVSVLESKNGVELKHEIEKVKEDIQDLKLKLQSVEGLHKKQEGRWKTFLNLGLQLVWVIIVAYILYKLNLQAPL